MSNTVLEFLISQGVWTVLSFLLIYYIMKNQDKRDTIQDQREKKYQKIIENLSHNFEIIHADIQDIKKYIEVIEEDIK